MKSLVVRILTTLALASLLVSFAQAQATRTWVSGVGDDANPCSRTAPCKTFAGAISKTAAGGEISALDPGGFGAFTITKSITINGDGNLTSIVVSGTNGVTINAGASDVENCTIYGFGQAGIDLEPAASTSLAVKNVSITGGATGVRVNGSSGTVNASLSDVRITGSGDGIDALFGSTDVRDSTISQSSGTGVLAEAGSVTVVNTALTGNNVAAQSQTGATIRGYRTSTSSTTLPASAAVAALWPRRGTTIKAETSEGAQPASRTRRSLCNERAGIAGPRFDFGAALRWADEGVRPYVFIATK